jgi:heterodisulfide reductase subunit C/nitrate reductase gamma subunit
MNSQIIFALLLLLTFAVFGYTVRRLAQLFSFTRKSFPVKNIGRRILVTLKVAIGQSRIFRNPFSGILHALVFWGFCVILIGSIEMVVDGLSGSERALSSLGGFYNFITASGDLFGLIIAIAIIVFIVRRISMRVKRFEGVEMKRASHTDAYIALTMILLLMVTLLGMNSAYYAMAEAEGNTIAGVYPVSSLLAGLLSGSETTAMHIWHEIFWWSHIVLIFVFANMLPYSKHFHVFLSVPNVFLSRLEPLGKMVNMESITREVKLMMNPETAYAAAPEGYEPERFGVKDAEDVSWKNYFDSLSCTQCGRCTSVCPANITGKMLSPRKIMMDLRARMKDKGPGMIKEGRGYNDNRALVRDYITEEELWACTTCNACARECPININQPELILEMRRYLVMEEGAAPGGLKALFSNIENNGAPWQYSREDRMLWATGLEINKSN